MEGEGKGPEVLDFYHLHLFHHLHLPHDQFVTFISLIIVTIIVLMIIIQSYMYVITKMMLWTQPQWSIDDVARLIWKVASPAQ